MARHLLDQRAEVRGKLVEFALVEFPFLLALFDDDLRRLVAFAGDRDARVGRQFDRARGRRGQDHAGMDDAIAERSAGVFRPLAFEPFAHRRGVVAEGFAGEAEFRGPLLRGDFDFLPCAVAKQFERERLALAALQRGVKFGDAFDGLSAGANEDVALLQARLFRGAFRHDLLHFEALFLRQIQFLSQFRGDFLGGDAEEIRAISLGPAPRRRAVRQGQMQRRPPDARSA